MEIQLKLPQGVSDLIVLVVALAIFGIVLSRVVGEGRDGGAGPGRSPRALVLRYPVIWFVLAVGPASQIGIQLVQVIATRRWGLSGPLTVIDAVLLVGLVTLGIWALRVRRTREK